MPIVDLGGTPFFATRSRARPTLTLALSVEYPTVGAQYRDASYNSQQAYIGYFDNKSCYTYNNDPKDEQRRYFKRSSASSAAYTCSDGNSFSGNFMNWASTSAIDTLRLGLTGGDRIVDEADLTVLQRAVLPNTVRFWNGTNFPSKQISTKNARGLVPNALIGTYPELETIHISNILDRIHFSFSSASANSIRDVPSEQFPLLPGHNSLISYSALPQNSSRCAASDAVCRITNRSLIAYGRSSGGDNRWIYFWANSDVTCSVRGIGADPWPSVTKECQVVPYNNAGTTANNAYGAASLTANNFFYTRVRVCDSADVSSESNCLRYPGGNYKPVGNLQKYSDRLRVAAFGYLLDPSTSRYGGVLRAPMKFVGPRGYDDNGLLSSANNALEWDEHTGVFKPNPDNAQEGNSGVINYLNKFGRLSTSNLPYKVSDPVAELYYEALRYLQGLKPTKEAYSGMTVTMKDNFPIHETWTDPWANGSNSADYACVRNNILLIGDQNVGYDRSIPGNTVGGSNEFSRAADPKNNEPDFKQWNQKIGELEGISTLQHDGNIPYASVAKWGSNYSLGGYYLAGMAYWANTNDIRGTKEWYDSAKRRPGMRVTTYVLDVNENGNMSIANRRQQSPFFLAAKYGGFRVKDESLDNNTPFNNGNSWASANTPEEAQTYFLSESSQAQSVLDALDNIFVRIASQANSIAGGAVSTSSLTSNVTGYLYNAQFDASDWSGDLIASPIKLSSSGVNIGSTAWSAATQLASRLDRSATRNIVVGNSSRGNATASSFTWSAIESSLKSALDLPSPSATAQDGHGEKRLAYLRGSQSDEGSLFRQRASLLGDIINSGIVISGTPRKDITDSDYYRSSFYTNAQSRTPTLYAGSNDGMLHAFDASNGDELFAYIPSWIAPRLSAQSKKTYVADAHQSGVDATPAVAEAKVGDAASGTWKTVLVSGTGAGGQGIFALDVSDSKQFSANKVMWEFTDKDDASLGNIMGAPRILKFAVKRGNTGVTGSDITYKWFAVVASGVNNHANDGSHSTSGNPAIFLLDLAHDGTKAWVAGRDYFKIELPASPQVSAASGLIGFTPQMGSYGQVLKIYAGDLHGQLWRLDFSRVDDAPNGSPFPSDGNGIAHNIGNTVAFFIAQDSAGKRQPITAAPQLLKVGSNKTIVAFGTGKYLESADFANTDTQSAYAILDDGSSQISRNQLAVATAAIDGSIGIAGGLTWGIQRASNSTIHPGWYYDYPSASKGERQIATGSLYGKTLLANSMIPQEASSNACYTGSSNIYAFDLATGNATTQKLEIGVLSSTLTLDTSEESTPRDSVGRIIKTRTSGALLLGSTGTGTLPAIAKNTYYAGRLNWRQIPDYRQSLRSSVSTK